MRPTFPMCWPQNALPFGSSRESALGWLPTANPARDSSAGRIGYHCQAARGAGPSVPFYSLSGTRTKCFARRTHGPPRRRRRRGQHGHVGTVALFHLEWPASAGALEQQNQSGDAGVPLGWVLRRAAERRRDLVVAIRRTMCISGLVPHNSAARRHPPVWIAAPSLLTAVAACVCGWSAVRVTFQLRQRMGLVDDARDRDAPGSAAASDEVAAQEGLPAIADLGPLGTKEGALQ